MTNPLFKKVADTVAPTSSTSANLLSLARRVRYAPARTANAIDWHIYRMRLGAWKFKNISVPYWRNHH